MPTREWYKTRIAELEEGYDSREAELFSLRGKNWQLQKRIFNMERANKARYEMWEKQMDRIVSLFERIARAKINKELKSEVNEYIRKYTGKEDSDGE